MKHSKHLKHEYSNFRMTPSLASNRKKTMLVPEILTVLMVSSIFIPSCSISPQAGTSLTSEPSNTPSQQVSAVPAANPTRASESTRTTAPDLGKIKNGIQQSLDLYARAFNNNDIDLLSRAVDQAPPFWRFVNIRFDNFQKSFIAGQTRFSYTVKDIKLRDYEFVQARISTRGGGEVHWLFHEQDGKWVLAEPTVDQIGAPSSIDREYFIFHTYLWADETNPKVIQLMENARNRVLRVLGKVPEEKANVRIKPIYAVSPFDNPFAVAHYDRGYSGKENNIEIFSPHSYGYGAYDPTIGWEEDLETILTHEYTHMTHYRIYGNAGQLCGWIGEGLAEYVAGNYHTDTIRYAVRSGNVIPIVDAESPVYKQDLNHLVTLKKDRALGYGFSVSLVIFITKNYGGLDALWKLADLCDKTVDFDIALQQSLGVTLTKFDKDWRAWLKTY